MLHAEYLFAEFTLLITNTSCCFYTVNRVFFKIPCAMAIYHMPHYDRELTFPKVLYNLYIHIIKFNCQTSIPALSTFLTVYLYGTLANVPSRAYWILFIFMKYFKEPEKCCSHSSKQTLSSRLLSVVLNLKLQRYVRQQIWEATLCIMAWPHNDLQFGVTAAPWTDYSHHWDTNCAVLGFSVFKSPSRRMSE